MSELEKNIKQQEAESQVIKHHTYSIFMIDKMAEKVEDEIENALNLVVSTAGQSSNKWKTLKDKIYETVSTL